MHKEPLVNTLLNQSTCRSPSPKHITHGSCSCRKTQNRPPLDSTEEDLQRSSERGWAMASLRTEDSQGKLLFPGVHIWKSGQVNQKSALQLSYTVALQLCQVGEWLQRKKNTKTVLFKTAKVMKNKARLRNCHRQNESRETECPVGSWSRKRTLVGNERNQMDLGFN